MTTFVRRLLSAALAVTVGCGPAFADARPYLRFDNLGAAGPVGGVDPGDGGPRDPTSGQVLPLVITGPTPLEAHVFSFVSQAYVANPAGTYVWAASGLPDGLTINQAGVISGVPKKAGTYAAAILVIGPGVAPAKFPLTVHVRDVLKVINAQDRTAHTGERFSIPTPTVLGDPVPPLSWTTSSPLPNCMTLDGATGVVSGNCSATSVTGASLKLTDATKADAVSNSFTVTIGDGIHIGTIPDLSGRVGMPFTSFYPSYTGAYEPPLAWTLASGDPNVPQIALPDGLTFDKASGSISGLPTKDGSASGYEIVGTDQSGFPSVSNPFAIHVDKPVAIGPVVDGWTHVGAPLSLSPPTLDNNPAQPVFWEMVGATPPGGMTFSNATGAIDGKPTQAGTTTAAIRATDVQNAMALTGPFSIHVLAPMTVGKVPDISALTGEQVDYTPPVPTPTHGALTWTTAPGSSLPDGVVLDPDTGRIVGTSTVGVAKTVALSVIDEAGGKVSTNPFAISFATSFALAPMDDVALRVGDVLPGNAPVALGHPSRPLAWKLSKGSVDGVGLTFDPATGIISGTATGAGDAVVEVQGTDATGVAAATSYGISVLPPLAMGDLSILTHVSTPATVIPQVDNSPTAPVRFTLASGALPDGFTLDPATGAVTGSGKAPVKATFSVLATDAKGATATGNVSVDVEPALAVGVVVGQVGRVALQVTTTPPDTTNAIGSVTWTLAQGTAPDGMAFSNGGLAGKPSAAGHSEFVLQAVDSVGGDAGTALSAPFTIDVLPPLTISTIPDVLGHAGIALRSTQPTVGNSPVPPLTWATTTKFPAGLSFDTATAIISGTTTEVGATGVAMTVTDKTGATAVSNAFVVDVVPGIVVADVPDATFRVGNPFLASAPEVTNQPVLPVAWSIPTPAPPSSGFSLPNGLSLDPATGKISGTALPNAYGTFPLQLAATDASGGIGYTNTFKYTVLAALAVGGVRDQTTYVGRDTAMSLPGVQNSPVSPIAWSLAAATPLPPGMTFDATTGAVQGKPTTVGSYPLAYQAVDANGDVATPQHATLTVTPAMSVDDVPDISTRVGLAVDYPGPVVRYPVGQVTTALGLDAVPGLGLSRGGGIAGTPTTAGTFGVAYTVTDSDGQVATTHPFKVVVKPALGIDLAKTASAHLGSPAVLATPKLLNAPVAPVKWGLPEHGTLPDGFTLDAATGVVSGTATTAGDTGFTIVAQDAEGAGISGSVTVSILGPLSMAPVADQSTHVTYGVSYQPPSVTGNPQLPLSWAFAPGSNPPAGVTLDPASGLESGTPTVAGDYVMTLVATDRVGGVATSSPFTLHVYPPIAVGAATGASGRVGMDLSTTAPVVSNNPVQPVTWTLKTGTTPPGLKFSAGAFGGTPTVAGSYPISLTLKDGSGATLDTNAFTVDVKPALAAVAPTVTSGHVGMAYKSDAPSVTGNPHLPVTWTGGGIPGGLSVDPATGVISGTPTTASTQTVQANLTVTDVDGATATTDGFPMFVYPALAMADLKTPLTYHQQAAVSIPAPAVTGDARTPVKWAVASGMLPHGISIDPVSGNIAGSPDQAGNYTFSISMTDATQQALVSNTVSVTIVAPLYAGAVANGQGRVGLDKHVTAAPDVSGNPVTPLAWSVAPGYILPDGMVLDSTVGFISGPPKSVGTTHVALVVTDASGGTVTTDPFDIVVGPALTLSSGATYTVHTGVGGDIVSVPAPTLGNGPVGTVTWSTYKNTTLPNGIYLNQDGTITSKGVLTNALAGTSAVIDVVATDSEGATVHQAGSGTPTTLVFIGPIAIANVANANAYPKTPYSSPVPTVLNNPTAPVTWALTGNLPSGLSFHADTGVIDGTPDAAAAGQAYNLSLVATDARGLKTPSSNVFSITVGQPLAMAQVADATIHNDKAVTITAPALTYSTTPVKWTLSSTDPALTADSASGNLTNASGGAAGTYPVTLSAQDATGQVASTTYNLTVIPALAATVASKLQGHVGAKFPDYPVTATNSFGTLAYALSVGSPAGTTFDTTTGMIKGTPTAAVNGQAATITVNEAGPYGETVTMPVTISAFGAMTATAPASIEGHDSGAMATAAPTSTNGVAPLTWTVASGSSLPPGMSIPNATTGVVSGAPTVDGTYPVVLTATDATGVAVNTGTFNIKVDPPITLAAPMNYFSPTLATTPISASNPLLLRYGVTYSSPFVATNGVGTLNYTSANVLNYYSVSTSGVFSGMGKSTGPSTGTMSVTVADSSSSGTVAGSGKTTISVPYAYYSDTFSLSSYPTQPAYVVGDVVSIPAPTVNGSPIRPVLKLNTTSGTLPAGLTFNPDGSVTGTITGAGSFTGTATVSDDTGYSATNGPLTITAKAEVDASVTVPSTAGDVYGSQTYALLGTIYDGSTATLLQNGAYAIGAVYLNYPTQVTADDTSVKSVASGVTSWKVYYNTGTSSSPTWTLAAGKVHSTQYKLVPYNGSTATTSSSIATLMLGYKGQYPTPFPTLNNARTTPKIGQSTVVDLASAMGATTTDPTQWTVTGLPSYATQGGTLGTLITFAPTLSNYATATLTVTVKDATGQSVTRTLAVDPAGTSASTVYPTSWVINGGQGYVGGAYDNNTVSSQFANNVSTTLTFAQPVSADSVQVTGNCSSASVSASVNGAGNRAISPGSPQTATQFNISYVSSGGSLICTYYGVRLGDSSASTPYPAYLPTMTASPMQTYKVGTAVNVTLDTLMAVRDKDASGVETWAVASGTVPSWMTVDLVNGKITGTPTTASGASTFNFFLTVKDGRGVPSFPFAFNYTVPN